MREIRCRVELLEDVERRSPGRLVGTLLTYGEKSSDRAEVFAPGSLSWSPQGVVLRRQHDRSQPILRFIPELLDDKLVIDAILDDTLVGRSTATEIRSGLFTGLSVEFRASKERQREGLREIVSAELVGAGLVDSPSYANSHVDLRHKGLRRRRVWL